ncbi:MAG: tetratricopeptide repeat protein, partial [Candidatus Omnitrophica bacterium]|nr:tetratricopeptide repeat protein [Candidatus Omnitrophota bacterium]
PVATLTYFIDYSLFKLNPFGWRLTNLLIHIINAILLYLLLNILFSNTKVSFFSAILFGIHPLYAEVLNCTAFRPNSLAFLFSILAIILYLKFRARAGSPRFSYLFISLVSSLLALFSKEIAVVLPLALALCEYYLLDFDFKRLLQSWRYYALYFIVVILYLLVYFIIMPPTQKIFIPAKGNIFIDFIRMFDILAIYIKSMIWPLELVFIPPMIVQASVARIISGAIVLLVSIYIVARKTKLPKEVSFGVLWFFLWLLPMNNFMNTFRILLAYRYVYAAGAAFAIILGSILARIWQREAGFLREMFILRRFLVFSCFAFFAMNSIFTDVLWKDEDILLLSVAEKYPHNPYAHIAIGRRMLSRGNYEAGVEEFNAVLSMAPGFVTAQDLGMAYSGLGMAYCLEAEYAKSRETYLRAIKLFPQQARLYIGLGICYNQQGLHREAEEQFQKAKQIKKDR